MVVVAVLSTVISFVSAIAVSIVTVTILLGPEPR